MQRPAGGDVPAPYAAGAPDGIFVAPDGALLVYASATRHWREKKRPPLTYGIGDFRREDLWYAAGI